MWQGVSVLNSGCVQLSEVQTEAQLAVFLPHRDHGRYPKAVRGVDNAALQHFIALVQLPPATQSGSVYGKKASQVARVLMECSSTLVYQISLSLWLNMFPFCSSNCVS